MKNATYVIPRTWLSHSRSYWLCVVAFLAFYDVVNRAQAFDYNLHITCPSCTDSVGYAIALTGTPAGTIASSGTGGSGGVDFGWFGGSGPSWSWGSPDRIFTGTISRAGTVVGTVTVNFPPVYVTETTVGAGATQWTITGNYTNRSDYARTIRIDLGDGSPVRQQTLAPGEVYHFGVTNTVAPTTSGTVEVSGPGAPDTGNYYAFTTIAPEDWNNNAGTGGAGTSVGTVTPGMGAAVDTSSKTTPKIDYATPSGTASESTLQTGFASVRAAIVDMGSAIVGKLNDIFGRTVTAVPSSTSTSASTAGDSADATIKGSTVGLAGSNPTVNTTTTAWTPGFTVMGETVVFMNMGDSQLNEALSWWRAFLGMSCATMFLVFAYRHASQVLTPVLVTPSQNAASHVPVASSASALGMATLVTVTFAAALGVMGYLAIHLTATGIGGSAAPGSWSATYAALFGYADTVNANSGLPAAMYLAAQFAPMALIMALIVAAPIYEISAQMVAWGSMAAIRHFVG